MAWKDFSNRIKLKQSFLLACFLVISGYFMNNLPLFMGESGCAIWIAQKFLQLFNDGDIAADSAVYIDVGYDSQLANYYNNEIYSDSLAITDRRKLCSLLDMLKCTGYKYIILDVLFEPHVTTPSDSELYERISSMDRIVVAKAPEVPMVDELKDKASLVDYMVTALSDGYSKDEFLRPHGFCWGGTSSQDDVSLPLKVYEDLVPERKLRRYGYGRFSVYFSGNHLCYNGIFPQLSSFKEPDWRMGDLLYSYNKRKSRRDDTDGDCLRKILPDNMSDKLVVIGSLDMSHDVHETNVGARPGGQILYEVYRCLENGQQIVSWWQIISWFLLYWIIGCFVLNSGVRLKPIRPVSRTINYLLGLLSFSFVLVCGQAVSYIIGVYVPSIWLPILCFSIVKMFINFKKTVI